MKKRFSKETVAEVLMSRINNIQAANKFDHNNGYAQVIGRGEEKNGVWSL